MTKIETHIAFVKDQIEAQEKMANKYEDQSYRAARHLATAQKHKVLLQFLEELERGGIESAESIGPQQPGLNKRLSLTLNDIEDLPDDLIKELNLTEADRQEMIIEDIISKSGGVLSLDRIIVELYRRTGEIIKRNALISRLYRMAQRGMIYSVPGRKGIYSTYEMTESEANRLFGGENETVE